MSDVTLVKWAVNDLRRRHDLNPRVKEPSFSLNGYPSSGFALILTGLDFNVNGYSFKSMELVALKIAGLNQLKFCIKMRREDAQGRIIKEQTFENFTFEKTGSQCSLDLAPRRSIFPKKNYDLQGRQVLCCEIKCLNGPAPSPSPPAIKQVSDPPSNSLNQKMWKLYLEQQECDGAVLIEGNELKIHRSVFVAHSEVFRTMFASGFKEGADKKVKIKDSSVPSVEALIRWIYLGEIVNKSAIEDLYVLADMYMIEDLKTQCAKLMLQDLSDKNFARRLSLALAYKNNKLKEHIFAYIKQLDPEKICKAFQSPEWRDFLVKQ